MKLKNKCEVCEYCGGCNYQGIDYDRQLIIKQEKVDKLLGKFHKVKPIISSTNPYNYRNKVQVSYGYDEYHHMICGNYIPSSHFIVPIDECNICDEGANKIIKSVNKLINKYKISIFDERAMKGCLRHLLIRCNKENEYMLVLVTGSSIIKNKELFINDILKYNNNIKTIIQNINNKHTSMILSNKSYILYGNGRIIDKLCGFSFEVSESSFFQVNKYQTENLYNEAIKNASLNKNDILIDAYCGTGTIGLIMSKHVKKVIGVEINSQAIKDANRNKKLNKIDNIEFVLEDASNYMSKLAKQKAHIDVLVMDPPRSGADDKFLKATISLRPNKIIYISCNPITLKDNLNYLSRYYNIKSVRPVDMFPFTEHIECVVSMQRKDN